MTYPETFEGFGSPSLADWNKTKKFSYKPKTFEPHDVDIKIECCGVCGSDVHCGKGDWGEPYRPIVLGHEIVGTVVKVGPEVTDFKLGQRVGVGALCKSCGKCERCLNGQEPYCPNYVHTYSGFYEDGTGSQGGYASHIRVDDGFVFPIPENIASTDAAPLFCAGATAFSPLKRYGVGPGKVVGVSGIGGVGHVAILLAKAMGAEVYAFSRNNNKREDAAKLGADHYVATEKEGWEIENFDKIDVMVNCSSSLTQIDFTKMAKVMHVNGTIISISAPEASEILTMSPIALVGCTMGVTHVGTKKEILEMLDIVSKHKVKPWIEKLPVCEENVNKALTRAEKSDVKYRFVFTDFDKEFK